MLTKDESGMLMENIPFRRRVKVSICGWVTYVFNEPPETPGHPSRYRWAQTAQQNPEMAAMQLQSQVVMDGAVQAEGIYPTDGDSTIDDAALQSSVEAVINKLV